jgi:ABC-type multidrug transport system fused ATPase/permease subunit
MEPLASADPAISPPRPKEQPKTSIPTTIGILNIVVGSLLLLCVLCSSLNMMIQGPMMGMQQQQFQQAMQAERQQMLLQLQEREKASNDEKEKAELRGKQKALEGQPLPKMPDFNKFTQDVQHQGFMIVDLVTGSVLNVLMLVSGIALCCYKEWGRVTAIWVAVLKIVLLVALYTFFALVVVPVMVKGFNTMFQEMFEEMAKAAPPGRKMPTPPPGELAQLGMFMGIAMTATAVAMIIFGSIYPIVVLILLTRPRVKAALASPPATKGDSLSKP